MTPGSEIQARIDEVGGALAQALGDGAVCIAVYGSAAGDDFAPAHSDVNLLLVLRRVTFADLRLIGATLEREAGDLAFATPLVITPSFLEDARDSFPIELADIAARHRVLHGADPLSAIRVDAGRLREQAEREARSALLRLRTLVIHRPPEEAVHHVLSGLAATVTLIERTLLRETGGGENLRGRAVLGAVQRSQDVTLTALPRLQAMRDAKRDWPRGPDLDDLVAATLQDVEALVRWVDTHPYGRADRGGES